MSLKKTRSSRRFGEKYKKSLPNPFSENFTEIYRYDGPSSTSTSVAGVSATLGATSITDTNPPPPDVFDRFGAQTAP
ncbi:MAG: hypothetical protein QNK83_05205 [Akkermansiaceae bacterium]